VVVKFLCNIMGFLLPVPGYQRHKAVLCRDHREMAENIRTKATHDQTYHSFNYLLFYTAEIPNRRRFSTMTSTSAADIIDLTEDLSDLGCAPQESGTSTGISSAKKRYRPSASQDLVDRDGAKRRPRESRGLATYGDETHYRSISHKGMDIEVRYKINLISDKVDA
jgi:hypothetical protein